MSFSWTRRSIVSEPLFIALALLCAGILALGCNSDRRGALGDVGDIGSSGSEVGPDPSSSDCSGPSGPSCVMACGDDNFFPPKCRDGEWVCPRGGQFERECPDDTCWGKSQFRCVETCEESEGVGPVCPGGAVGGRQDWQCPAGTFNSEKCQALTCDVEMTHIRLDGVRLRFTGDCEWSVDEVRQGVTIPYEVVVEEKVDGVVPVPTDAGQCDRPGPSGLIVDTEINGDGQRWCRCNLGNCPSPELEPRTLNPGTYAGEIEWSGRNWTGPADTGRPKAEAFPPGTYEISLSADGKLVSQQGEEEEFQVETTMKIELKE